MPPEGITVLPTLHICAGGRVAAGCHGRLRPLPGKTRPWCLGKRQRALGVGVEGKGAESMPRTLGSHAGLKHPRPDGSLLLSYRAIFPYLGLQIITLSDLECDYINARSCCSKLNKWVVPEVIGHAVVTVLMLISLHWFIFLLNLPVATWNIYRYIMVPSGNMGVFDPTEIHNRGQLKSHMKEAMIKLGFHLLCFFMYLYSMILALIND
ncbi:PREDICTED: protein cornichon homolog 4 [Pygoscelis adeliae]|nr:PREDICTED: protein cornichon homolog 4 [Pygoscelis adeliae]